MAPKHTERPLPKGLAAAITCRPLAASTSVADEIEGKTALTVLSKPVSRRDFILGKFVGIAWTVLVMFVMFGAVMLVTVTYKTIYDAREYSTDMEQITWQVCHNEMMQTIPGLFLAYMETLVLAALMIGGFGIGKKWLDDRNRPNSTAVQVTFLPPTASPEGNPIGTVSIHDEVSSIHFST